MPYGQKDGDELISIDINALRAKEKKKFKQFLSFILVFFGILTTILFFKRVKIRSKISFFFL